MMYTPTITIDGVVDALADFIQPFCGNAEIIRGQINRVSPPASPFVVITEILQVDIETPANFDRYADNESDISTPTRIDLQIDFYGDASGDYCKAVKAVFRSGYAPTQFPDNIQPLYCSDGLQSPLISGEHQFLQRWTMTATLQYNPMVAIPLESADTLTSTSNVPVDLT